MFVVLCNLCAQLQQSSILLARICSTVYAMCHVPCYLFFCMLFSYAAICCSHRQQLSLNSLLSATGPIQPAALCYSLLLTPAAVWCCQWQDLFNLLSAKSSGAGPKLLCCFSCAMGRTYSSCFSAKSSWAGPKQGQDLSCYVVLMRYGLQQSSILVAILALCLSACWDPGVPKVSPFWAADAAIKCATP